MREAGTTTDRPTPRRSRTRLIAVLATAAFVAAACAPPSPPAGGGGLEVDFGPLTVPLPPIEIRPPETNIPLGLCSAGYRPPGVEVIGATLTIPRVRIDPTRPVITVPDVQVRIPQLRVPTSTVTLRCGLIVLPTQIDLIIPSSVHVRAATLDLDARTITLTNPSFTIEGAGLGVLGLGDLIVPLPPIVSVPLPTTAIAF
jgi:hypothetical protein